MIKPMNNRPKKTNFATKHLFSITLGVMLLTGNGVFAQQKFGDNLGNHSATKDLLLNSYQLLNANGITIGTAVFSSTSVALEISATNKALLISRLATHADMLALTAVNGMLVYVTGDSKFYLYQGNAWAPISTSPNISVGAPNTTSTANGFTLSALGVLALSPADATNPGIVTTGTQTLAGDKTLSGITTVSNTTASTTATTGALVVTGGAGITGDVNLAANFVAKGGGTGNIPTTGTGSRMMWYSKKAAFRAGYAFGTEWDDNNLATYSVAFGVGNTASGSGSTVFGSTNLTSGDYSTAFGSNNIASGLYSTAFGSYATASGDNSIAFGSNNIASGNFSIALGNAVSTNNMAGTFIIGDGNEIVPTLSTNQDQMTTRFASGYRFLIDGAATKGITMSNTGLATYIKDYSAASYSAISDAKTLVPKGYVDSKVLTLATPNAASTANAATVTAGVLALSPADATNPGIVNTTAQTLAGAKTLSGITTVSNATASTSAATGALVVTGGAGIAGDVNIGVSLKGNIGTATLAAASTISNFSAALSPQTGTTYTLTLADNGKIITMNNAAAITLTVPATLGAGFNCMIVQTGAGQVTIAGSGTTVSNRQSFTKTAGQNAIATIIALTGTTFITSGDMQ
jgi:hypothetical protein